MSAAYVDVGFRAVTGLDGEGLELSEQLAHGVLGVAKEQSCGRLVEQLVFDPREARTHRALHEDNLTRLVGMQDRHAVDRGSRSGLRRRVDNVVGANDKRDVSLLELRVDLDPFP